MKKFFKTIFWIVWIGFLIFCHFSIPASKEYNDSSTLFTGILLIAIWWALTIGITAIKWKLDDKKSVKKEKEYQKNVDSFEYNNDIIGKIVFKKDDNKNTLSYTGIINNLSFAGEKIDICMDIKQGIDINKVMNNLINFCSNSHDLKERIYKEFNEYLKDCDNFDKYGNFIEITEQFLRDNLVFQTIEVSYLYLSNIENEIGIFCNWESSGSQDYLIVYNIQSDTLSFQLL